MKYVQFNNSHREGTKAHEIYKLQYAENDLVEAFYEKFADEFGEYYVRWTKFLNCNAQTAVLNDYIILKSYRTIIAVYDRKNNCFYDFLRYVFGYTSTSAQHISKFIDAYRHDYNYNVHTWRDLK